jgi:hypothetical protein
MSRIKNRRKVLKNCVRNAVCDDNALSDRKNNAKVVTIKYFIFLYEIIENNDLRYFEIFNLKKSQNIL